jgi:membrane associated rhomboid family serine protease
VDQDQAINGEVPAKGPWSDLAAAEPPKEPLSKAPWPPLVIAAVLIAIYAWQTFTGDAAACAADYARASCIHYGFAPNQLDIGQWYGLVTALCMCCSTACL